MLLVVSGLLTVIAAGNKLLRDLIEDHQSSPEDYFVRFLPSQCNCYLHALASFLSAPTRKDDGFLGYSAATFQKKSISTFIAVIMQGGLSLPKSGIQIEQSFLRCQSISLGSPLM